MGTNSEESLFLSPANFEAELRLNRNLLLLVRTESCRVCEELELDVFSDLKSTTIFLNYDQRLTYAMLLVVNNHAYESFISTSVLADHEDELNEKGYLIFFNRKSKVDRSCLLTGGEPLPEFIKFPSSEDVNFQTLLAFINVNARSFLTSTGELSEEGKYVEVLSKSVFIPKTGDQCAEIEGAPTREQFFDMVARSRPTIMRGAAKHWPAYSKWTNEFLIEKFGHYTVNVKANPSGDYEGCESASLWEDPNAKPIPQKVRDQLESPDKVVTRPADISLKFSDFMALLNRSEEKGANFYLEYFPIKEVPSMMKDVIEFPWAESLLDREMFNVWVGDGKTLGKLHFDPFDNLMVVLAGRKRFITIDPYQNEDLYEGHIREAKFEYHEETSTFTRSHLMDSTSLVMSPVDIQAPDLTTYPRFASKIGRYIECDVGEGDVFYLPSFWWHEVQSAPDRYARNLAVNFWYTPFYTKEFPCRECRPYVNIDTYSRLLTEFAPLSAQHRS